MSDLLAECDWRDGTLFLVLPEDPERIGVRLFPSRYAPSRMYVPEAEIVLTKAENAKLREQTELLVTLLRNDCDIEASWDGLRHFWSIELTEDGCLMRDRACKAEAENAKLQELCADMYGFIKRMDEDCGDVTFSDCFDYCKHDTADDGCCKTGECWYEQRLRELGIEVD